MSQVRKYEQGGAASSQQTQTSTPKTYGKFIMNGQEEQVTDDLINQFSSWLSSQDRDVQTSLAPIRKKLQAGEDINFDSHAQELSDNSGLPLKNDRQDRRMRRQRSGAGMLFDALTNNNVHKNAVAMEALSGFRYNKPAPPAPPKPTKVNFSERVLDYNTSEDGKTRTYSANPTNAAAWGNVDKWFDYLDMDEEGRKGYEYGGFQGMSLQEMLDYGPDRATVMAAKQRIIADQATQDDWDIINRFNIWDPKSKSQPAAPQTPEDKKKAADQTIADHGLDIEQANQFGIGLNEDMSLDLSRLANDRVHIFGDYGPITKGKYYGGAYYNGKLYTKDEAEKDETLLKLLAPYREQIAKGNYNDTSSVNYWWGRDPAYRTYNPQSNFYGEFGDHLGIKDENGQVKSQSNPFMWLNNTHSLGEGESLIAVPDFESGTNPLTGMANKMKYLHYNPQTGVSVNYENMWGQRAEALQGDLVLPEWGNRYKNMQRYAPLFSRSNMNFAIGENDNRLYYEEDGDYYLVRDFDVYNKIKQGGHNVSRDDIDRLKRGTKSHGGVRAGKILLSEDKWWSAEDPKAQGYRFKAGDSRWSGDWVQFLQGLDSDRTKVLGTQKYQYGGSLRNVQGGRVQSTNQGTQLKDDVRIADTSAPKVIGDGQGLTSNDKLELAAMAADLAGLGLSFVPGYGNIAGAAAGVAGTGMQFAADVGRDGLDWGDVGRGAANLGLDVLTFIPGLGTAAKAGKVVRNIRRIGSTILKTLALTGAATGAVTAAQKIISGDKWTMDDLRIVVAGLQGGTAAGRSIKAQAKAGKQWKGIQNTNIKAKNQGITEGGLTTKKATLKGLEDTTITKGKGKKAKTSTVTNEVSKDLELKFTDKDIQKFNSLKGESAKNEFIAGKLKTDHNFTTTPEQTNSLMDAFALPKDKVLGFRGKGITQKGKIKGETKTPELTTRQAYKQVSQGFSPRKSTRATRTEAINATQPTANFALNRRAVTGSKKYPFLGPTKLWTVGQSPWRTIGITRMGQESNRALERDRVRTNLYQAYKDGGRISKFQPGGRTRLEDMNAISDWGNVLSDFGSRHYEQADLDILNAQHRARLGMGNTMRGANVGTFQTAFNNPLLSGIIGHVAGTTGYGQTAKGAYNSAQNGNYNVDNRVGGVTRSWIAGSEALQKYFSGPEALNRTSTNIIFDPKAENGQGAYRFMDSGIDGVGTDENPIDAGEVVVTAQGPKKAAAEVAPDASKQGGMGDLFKGGFARLGKLGIDPDNAMAIGSLAMALGHNNRQANVMKKGINTAMGALESSPFEIYPRFTDYGITAHYENAAQQQLGVKPATSDYLMSHAIEQDAKNKAEQLRLEGRMKVSELYSNYQDRTDDLRRNYAGMRTDVANRNRQRLAQLNMALAENEAGRLANQYTSWNNFIMEKRDRLAQDKAKNENFSNMLLRSQLAQDQQKAYSDALKVDQDQFNLLEEAERNKYRGVEDWLQRTNAGRYLELQNEYNKINEDILKKYGNSNMDYHTVGNKYPKWRGINNLFNPFVSRYASGGKTKAKSKSLNAAEQIWVNQNKDVADAVKQLNKNVITLFLKATT